MARTETAVREGGFRRFLSEVHKDSLNLHDHQSDPVETVGGRGLTQVEVAARAELSRPSVAQYAKRMRDVGAFSDEGLAIRPDSGYAIGVDIGEVHSARIALSDISGRILETRPESESDQLKPQTPDEALDFSQNSIEALLKAHEVEPSQVVGVGVSLPGPVMHDRLIGPYAGPWRTRSVAGELANRLEWPDVQFATQSDTYLSALAESLWAGGEFLDYVLYVKWSSRLRSAFVIDGELHTGHRGTAGELPHQTINELKRLMERKAAPKALEEHHLLDPCPVCGQRGCLHMVAPLKAISLAFTGEPNLRASHLIACTDNENGEERRILEIAARGIGAAILPILDALDPAKLIIGGALGSRAFPLVEDEFRALIDRSAPGHTGMTVAGSRVEEKTAVRGAVALALRTFAPSYLSKLA